MKDISSNDIDADVSSSCSFSGDDISLPPELLEREKQLMEKNQQLEQRVKDILKQSIDTEEPLSKQVRLKKQKIPSKPAVEDFIEEEEEPSDDNNFQQLNQTDNDQNLPKVRPSSTDNNIIEVEIPINVEPTPEVKYDPIPELRSAFHKIAEEIQGINGQIAEVESNKSKCEVVISKLQAELKKVQLENERSLQETDELTSQIQNNRDKIQQLKSDINSARLSKIEHVERQNETKQKQAILEKKIKRQKIAAEKLQYQINSMQTPEMRAAKIGCDKAKIQAQIDQEKKALRQLTNLLSEVQRASAHEEKIFDHLQSAKNISLTSETVERALSQLL